MKRFLPNSNSSKKASVFLKPINKSLFLVCFFLISLNAIGQTSIWTNPITGTNPAVANPYTTGQTVNSNITVSGIGYAAVLSALTSTNTYNVGDWTTSATINTGQYFSFTITPSTGYKVSMNSFVYTGTSGSRAPTSFAFRSDAASDNFTTNVGTPNAAGTTISLSGANYQNLSAATSFRFYGFNATNGSAASRAYAINDFTFNGSVLGSATTSLAFGSNSYGSAPVQTFQVNGAGLIPATATITVNGSTNYEVSTTSSTSGFGATATLTAAGGSLSGANVWVRLKGTTAVGTYNENITFGGGGVTGITIACSGTVTTAPLTITGITADNKTYDGLTTTTLSGTAAYVGLQNGESFSVTGSPSANFNTATVGNGKPVTVTGYTAPNTNYTVSQPSLTADITTAALSITANNGSKTYGQTYTVGSGSTAFSSIGLQNGETIGSITIASTGAIATAAVGSYNIVPSLATGGTFTASNYTITYNDGTLTVNPASLTITANNGTKVYGSTQSTPITGSTAFGSVGLQNGESIGTVTLTYGSGALASTDAVGSTSTITASAATGGTFTASNYSITYTSNSGTLTVTAAPLTITADNASKCFGTTYALGTSAFTSSGLQNSETIGSVTLSSSGAASGAAVGTYAITPSSATGGTFTASNYNITYTDGTLSVIALPNAPLGTNGAICSTGTVNISANVSGGETVDWYDASSGGTLLLSNSTTYTTPSISSTTIYYAEARNTTTGCVSGTRTAVTATVYATFTSGAILTTGETICYNGDPASIGNATVASGGDETITYKWQANGNDIPGSNSASYDPPAGLTTTTTYTRYAKDDTCNTSFTISGGSWVVTITNNNTWTGTVNTSWTNAANWSCGIVPASVSDVTISTSSNYPEISSNVSINTLTLNSGTTLKINPLFDLTITDVIVNNGTLTVENNANLIQVNDVANTGSGSTIVKRNSNPLIRLDYTMWSSPVSGQGLYAFSPFTFANRFYTYNTSTNLFSNSVGFNVTGLNGSGVNGTDNNSVPFATGIGYLIRLPYNHPTAPTTWTGNFTGTPNNGTKTITLNNVAVGQRFNLIGNPYPSAIDIAQFAADNSSNIESTIYFWRKTNNTASPSYCTWNTASSTFGDNGEAYTESPLGIIRTGQGFIVEAKGAATSVEFNNGQRSDDNADQFFRNNPSTNNTNNEAHRIWLNLTGATNEFSQMVVGYFTNATQGADEFDSKYFNDGAVALNTKIGATEYVIQGRALPFQSTDVIPLNFKVTNPGTYTLAIDHVDGLFTAGAQDIFIKDNLNGTYNNLNISAYTFASDAGTFADRFEIVYQSPLEVGSPIFNPNQVIIYKNETNDFVINTGNTVMSTVKVFDIRGRMLLEKSEINSSQVTITTGQANEVLLIQITSQDGLVVTKKVIR
ncbi:T9SS sorting signal type C domain-containing protein [Flavobacterium sp. IMCC34852]|uniref:T9SS sorting signal type C domain-containing protein n=1 Tax=Flavobacterium rivulicola TaxID=2732161 RepID=A0A7Y3VYU4_9FLAO|nr:MBG domain-containing protein [Flavobacterium sp. IMCC34852]NNT72034.1 T9SS sorting signal type C domain-containing protein [Flavobacterium sp. IMCC34852]